VNKDSLKSSATVSVAPMMDWTDRHCRYLHRTISKNTLLYTEMLTAAAIVNGDKSKLLDFNEAEHPLALQMGGSEPKLLADAVRIVEKWGYDEVNLNVGCPSDRVKSGSFGVVLMRSPHLVADCIKAMLDASQNIEITLKCRIGVDEDDPYVILPDFIEKMQSAGVGRLIIHARKAWLQGISPKQNRNLPPLDYNLIFKMKEMFPRMHLTINGGIQDIGEIKTHLSNGIDGVMIGRSAYHNPVHVLQKVDCEIYNMGVVKTRFEIVEVMLPYIERHLKNGGRLNQITRHMLGIFSAQPGAKVWRRNISEQAYKKDAGIDVLINALKSVVLAQKDSS
jgi:tRNA-dihydrouridine synthase A